MGKSNEVHIKYFGKRSPFHDRLYDSGLSFQTGQVRALPWDLARKFLRHIDLFEEHKPSKAETSSAADNGQSKSNDGKKPNDKDSDAKETEAKDDTEKLLENQKSKNDAKAKEQQELQALYDQVLNMDKDALEDFAKSKFQQDLDKRRSEDTLRQEVIGMIDQFGVV